MYKISFILTTLNEEDLIAKIINEIRTQTKLYEIIVIDDLSSDNTIDIIKNYNDENIKIFIRDFNTGLGSAIVSGIFHSSGDLVCWLDVSMDFHVKNIIKASKAIDEYDIILFSRYIKDGGDFRSLKRVIPSKIINLFARFVLARSITDYTGGLFLYKRSILKNILPSPIGHGNYFIDFIYRCKVNGLKIKQLPIVYKGEILEEKSKTFKNIISFIILGLRYLITIILTRLKKYIKI
jgi:glycosyltransferase involved in cell wall biosynthesis